MLAEASETQTHTNTRLSPCLFEDLNIDVHSFPMSLEQLNPNPPPNFNHYMPNPDLILISIHTLPLTLSLHPKI